MAMPSPQNSCAQPREIPAVQAQRHRLLWVQSRERIDERGLSRAVRSDHARKLARATLIDTSEIAGAAP